MKTLEIWLSEQMEVFARRIKEIEESPAPMVLRSYKLLWELEKERTEAQLDAWREDKTSAECPWWLARLCRAIGLKTYDFPAFFDETTRYAEYKTMLERMGFPEKCCERATAMLPMSEIGELPKPHIILNSGHGCDVKIFTRRIAAEILNVPVFCIDNPLNEDDKADLTDLNYITDQLGEFIEWAEKNLPGIKYDEDRHIESIEMDAIGEKYIREIWQLVKHVPCPIRPMDSHQKRIHAASPSWYPNMQKGIEFLRVCRDELGERVASGKGPYPEERLRLLWSGQVPEKSVLNVGKLLLERKVASPFNVGGNLTRRIGLRGQPTGEVSEYGVKLSPLQEEARKCVTCVWGGAGKRWVNSTLDVARDLGAHGIIHYLTVGCTPMRGMSSVVAERAEKEIGIPTLNIEGRLHDRDYMSQEQFEDILSPFIDKCFDWAGKPRQ